MTKHLITPGETYSSILTGASYLILSLGMRHGDPTAHVRRVADNREWEHLPISFCEKLFGLRPLSISEKED
jgi:hypothetical protein